VSLFVRHQAPPEVRDLTAVPAWSEASAGVRTHAGVFVSADQALRLGAVWSCVRLISDLIATLPVDTYRRTPDGQTERPPPELIRAPSRLLDWTNWSYQVIASLLLRGNAFGLITDSSAGWPTKIEILHPDEVAVRQPRPLAPPEYKHRGKLLDPAQMWHVVAFPMTPGSVVGLSPIQYMSQTIGTGLAGEEYVARFYGDGAHPTSAFSTDQPVTEEQAEIVKKRIVRNGKDRSPIVMGAGLKPIPLQISPQDAAVMESERWSLGTVARCYGVPPEMIGAASEGSGTLTYANREQRSLDLLTFTVGPWVVRLERAISALLPRPQQLKFNTNALLRTDVLTRFKVYETGIRNRITTPNEARELEDLDPYPGGDEFPPAPAATINVGTPGGQYDATP